MNKLPPLHLLQTLTVLSEQKSQFLTAQKLGLSQPAITKQIRQLEECFSFPLFRNLGRQKLLNEYGEALAKAVSINLRSLERHIANVNLQFLQPQEIGLKIGGRKEFLDKYLTNIHFEGLLDIQHLSSQQVIESLKNNDIDVGITHLSFNSAEYIAKKLFTDRPFLIVPEKWMKKVKTVKAWSEVCAEYPVATYSEELLFLNEFIQYFKIKEKLKLSYLVKDWSIVEKRVQQGLAWSIVPSLFARENRNYILHKGPDLEDHQYNFYIYYRKDLAHYSWFKKFLDNLRKV